MQQTITPTDLRPLLRNALDASEKLLDLQDATPWAVKHHLVVFQRAIEDATATLRGYVRPVEARRLDELARRLRQRIVLSAALDPTERPSPAVMEGCAEEFQRYVRKLLHSLDAPASSCCVEGRNQATDEDDLPSLKPSQVSALLRMMKNYPATCHLEDFDVGEHSLSRTTATHAVSYLREVGLAERPHGLRGGTTLTPKGRAIAKRLATSPAPVPEAAAQVMR